MGTAARRLAAWPLWLVHLSGSRVVRFSGCSRCVRLSACPFVDLSICRSVLPSFCASVLLSLCPSVLLSLWCTLTVCRSVLLSFCPSVLLSLCPSVLLSLWCTLTVCRSVLLSFCPFGAPSRCRFESPGMLLGTLLLHVAASTMRREACMLLVGIRHGAYSA